MNSLDAGQGGDQDSPHRYFSLVDGQPAEAESGQWIDVVSPSDGRVFAAIPRGGPSKGPGARPRLPIAAAP